MPVTALSRTSTQAPVGDVWDLTVLVTDPDSRLVAQTPTVTVTLPDGTTTTPTVAVVSTGVYRATYTFAGAGRHTASVAATGYGVETFVAYTAAVTTSTNMPDATEAAAYLGDSSWATGDIQSALDAESAAQRKVCYVPAEYPPDLREALKRRVVRNLAMRRVPLMTPIGDGDVNVPTFGPGSDPEVRRLEKPYLWVLMA